ncbi:hypothetical protein [Bradyrhizobium manausense]|uniref:hypothetical protein n=1 Tax=Bradyrhizobium manausense TaxID=989370 RepID=UPI000A9D0C13|nr:hypothetical protein [Bradyrhizobium manausense]
MTLSHSDRTVVTRLVRRDVEETLAGLKTTISASRWVTNSNRYASDPVAVIGDEIARNSPHQLSHLAQYIAASPILHATDGWTYLGKSLVALLRGDPHRAIHLAYYAELRAAAALLATEGIGVFSKHHFAVNGKNSVRRFQSSLGTHQFAWACLEHWATLTSASYLFSRMIRPQGIPLEDWFNSEGGASAVAPQAQAWFRLWGIDLRNFGDDRDARNLSSYQPDGIPLSWQIDARDALEFARDLWASLEPSPLASFDAIDRNILRIALETRFKAKTGSTPHSQAARFQSFVEGIVRSQGLSPAVEKELIRYLLRGSSPHDAIVFKYAGTSASDPGVGAHSVISRATLLLRLASGSSQLLLRAANIDAAAVTFWSEGLGRSRGLWDSPLADPMDMWADVSELLEQVEAFQQRYTLPDQTFFKIRSELSEALIGMAASERVAIWTMTP